MFVILKWFVVGRWEFGMEEKNFFMIYESCEWRVWVEEDCLFLFYWWVYWCLIWLWMFKGNGY